MSMIIYVLYILYIMLPAQHCDVIYKPIYIYYLSLANVSLWIYTDKYKGIDKVRGEGKREMRELKNKFS